MTNSPYQTVAEALELILNATFTAEGVVAIHDNLHPALGRNAVAVGIAPSYDQVNARNSAALEIWLEVRYYDLWTDEIDPGTIVDPRVIADKAERFRRAVQAARVTAGTDQVWFFDVMRVEYPNDPTGNKSRFVATLRAFGNNSGLVETA